MKIILTLFLLYCMSFWSIAQVTNNLQKIEGKPILRLGRYTDSYKLNKNYEAWDNTLSYFEAEDYLSSFEEFFKYLRDEKEDNVRWSRTKEGFNFEIVQGSIKVKGTANSQKFIAEAKIVNDQNLSVPLLRQLIESNHSLDYCRFALDNDNTLVLKFTSNTKDASPYKLYYGLKELAINADIRDDLLRNEFGSQPILMSKNLKINLTDKALTIKYDFLFEKINTLFNKLQNSKIDQEKYAGGISYLLLDIVYRIDCLTAPDGITKEIIEKIHRNYFSNKDKKSMFRKNKLILEELNKIKALNKDLILYDLYGTNFTFSMLTPKGHDALVAIIDAELPNRVWYEEHGYDDISLALSSYVVGNSLFNYALPKADRELLTFYYKIFEPDLFKSLYSTPQYWNPTTGIFDENFIKKAIKGIIDESLDKYPQLKPDVSVLDFNTASKFAASYLMMMRNLDFTTK